MTLNIRQKADKEVIKQKDQPKQEPFKRELEEGSSDEEQKNTTENPVDKAREITRKYWERKNIEI